MRPKLMTMLKVIRKKANAQDDVGSNVDTSLGQPDNPTGYADVVADEKDPNFETALEKDVNSGNTIENSHAEESRGSEGDSKKDEYEEDSGDNENDRDVVDVDELVLDDVPMAQTLGDSVAKRLRSN